MSPPPRTWPPCAKLADISVSVEMVILRECRYVYPQKGKVEVYMSDNSVNFYKTLDDFLDDMDERRKDKINSWQLNLYTKGKPTE